MEGREEEEGWDWVGRGRGRGRKRRRKEGGGGVMDGKVKERNAGGGSSEGGQGKGVEGGVGRIGLGAMKKTTGRRKYGRDGSLTPVGRCFRTNLSSSAGMHPS
jgi:hypothetical protein